MKPDHNTKKQAQLKKQKRKTLEIQKVNPASSLSIHLNNHSAMKNGVNEISLRFRGNFKIAQAPKISSSQSAAKVLLDTWNRNQIKFQECFKLLLLNNANNVKGIYEVSSGGITGTLVDLRIVFAVILKSLATAVIIAHYAK